MSEINRALARRWYEEVWNTRRDETIDELMHPEGNGHMEGGEVQGRAAFRAGRQALLSAFPDLNITVEDTVAEGDHVIVRWNVRATHTGSGLGLDATGRAVTFRGMTWLRFSNGLIVEGWDSWNQGALIETLRA